MAIRPFDDSSEAGKLSLIHNLKVFYDFFDQIDIQQSALARYDAVSPIFRAVSRILESEDIETKPTVRRGIYNTLAMAIKQQTSFSAQVDLTPVIEQIQRGLSDRERSIRLSARYNQIAYVCYRKLMYHYPPSIAAAELVKLQETLGDSSQIHTFLIAMKRLLDGPTKASLKETTLILFGSVAK